MEWNELTEERTDLGIPSSTVGQQSASQKDLAANDSVDIPCTLLQFEKSRPTHTKRKNV